MYKTVAAAAVLLAAVASPASAVTFITTPGSTATFAAPAGSTNVDFNNGAVPTGFTLTGTNFGIVQGDSGNLYAEPAFSDGSRYLAVNAGGSATLTSSIGFRSASLFLGSADPFNTIQVLSTAGAVLGTFTGSQLFPGANGNQDLSATNGRVFFNAEAGEAAIGGFRFLSSQNALEVDNVSFTAAVPEPATWAMMLMGFAAVGYSMRRRKATVRVAYAV